MTDKTIHLVFKTHLDIGFTDHASRVRRQYHDQFIPQALSTGEHFFNEDPEAPAFVWTTGAWLIWDHLNSQDAEKVRRLERAIERGLIAWHGLPFTTHTELMTPALFRAGLSYSAELDRRFGRTTIAAKMTDVPGHTLGMVPLMAEAGLKFLHLGVNTASPVPDVPPIFRWQAPGGKEIVVMYQGSYGATDFPAGEDIGLSFAHTNDNIGPQSVGQTVEALRQMAHDHPGARIMASTLDAFGDAMWSRREAFPIVTQEIGDSWIHGAATDPHKLARFRALSRLYDGFAEQLDERRLAFGRGLTMVAEHTWGVDIKTYLRDENAWDRADFDAARRSDYRFAYAEQSWNEQRAYLDTAVAALDADDQALAAAALSELSVPARPAAKREGYTLSHEGWRAQVDPETGSIAALTAPDGRQLAGASGCLMAYQHESFDWQTLQTHLDSYLQHRIEWAILDHDKPALAAAKTARTARFAPQFEAISEDGRTALGLLPEEARRALGGPAAHEFVLTAIDDNAAEIMLVLRDKPANRMPEAGFLSITPADAHGWAMQKLGLWHRPENNVTRGGGQLQACTALRFDTNRASVTVELVDAALVAPAASPFMPYQPQTHSFAEGARVNLYNNKWGTNFPMWWEGSVAFRFVLRFSN
ncbi:DUF5054 domain-containing protein [Devosia chinhatensis]|uniref:Glycosyl hydrolase n=1 Tax=Devosia chinhatensis TaxID=429727 RepID=A0A0F5FJE3_9HYPH|nr:DUF5054 domain-containing protein [Devosia chinhatensis]KKB08923.1 glycosyl hydrolase [Devosia chinhatensis]